MKDVLNVIFGFTAIGLLIAGTGKLLTPEASWEATIGLLGAGVLAYVASRFFIPSGYDEPYDRDDDYWP